MKMKKRIAVLLAVALLALVVAAQAEDNWYVSEGADLVSRMQELARDEAYCDIYTVMDEDAQKWLENLREAGLEKPMTARAIYIGEQEELLTTLVKLSPIVGDAGFEELMQLSETAKEELVKKLPASLVSLVAARLGGQTWIMMNSIINTGRAYLAPQDFRPCLLMLTYPGEVEAFVCFQRSGEGVAGASASLVPSGAAAFVEDYLNKAKAYGISFETADLPVQ